MIKKYTLAFFFSLLYLSFVYLSAFSTLRHNFAPGLTFLEFRSHALTIFPSLAV